MNDSIVELKTSDTLGEGLTSMEENIVTSVLVSSNSELLNTSDGLGLGDNSIVDVKNSKSDDDEIPIDEVKMLNDSLNEDDSIISEDSSIDEVISKDSDEEN